MRTTFENLFERVDYLVETVDRLYENVSRNQNKKKPPKNLSLDDAISFLKENGITISKSKVYKLTSEKKIPFTRFNGKLIFSSIELETWIYRETSNQNILEINTLKNKKWNQ